MATQITVNGAGPVGYTRYDLVVPPIPVQLDIQPVPGGAVVIAWTLYVPRGSTAVLSNPAIHNPTFTPDVEGTYRLALTLDGVADDGAVVGVPYIKYKGQRTPAQGETTEASTSEGWAIGSDPAGVNDLHDLIVRTMHRGGTEVAVAGQIMAVGQAVKFQTRFVAKSALPGQESIPVATLTDATTDNNCKMYGGVIVENLSTGAKAAGDPVAIGAAVLVQKSGHLMDIVNTAAGALGDVVYLTDVAGTIGLTPGTNLLAIGCVTNPIGASGSVYLYHGALPAEGYTQRDITSGAAITQYDIVTETGFPFAAGTAGHGRQFAGIALQAAGGAGLTVNIAAAGGAVVNGAWGWSAAGVALYADPAVAGGMTETPPAPAGAGTPCWRLQVAYAMSAVKVMVVEREPVWIPA